MNQIFLIRPQDSNLTVYNDVRYSPSDEGAYRKDEAEAFAILLCQSIAAPANDWLVFETDGDTDIQKTLEDSWPYLVSAAKQDKSVAVQPNTDDILRAVWISTRDRPDDFPVKPSLVIRPMEEGKPDTCVWFLQGVEPEPNAFARIQKRIPGFNPMGSLPMPGVTSEIIEQRFAYYTLDQFDPFDPFDGNNSLPSHSVPESPAFTDTATGSQQNLLYDGLSDEARFFADKTIAALREKFEGYKHYPSDEHWKGLREEASAFTQMVTGETNTFNPQMWITSLPCGMGKTQYVAVATRLLVSMPKYRDVGVIIFLQRLAEIENFVRDMGLDKSQFAVLTNSEEHNAMGNPDPSKAPVLFTTAQRLDAKCKGHTPTFESLTDFHFNGRTRQVRIWDEQYEPSRTLLVDHGAIAGLSDDMGRVSRELRDSLIKWSAALIGIKDGAQTEVVNFERVFDSLEACLSCCSSDRSRETAEALYKLSGRLCRVHVDRYGTTILNYEYIYPEDLAPMLILDASGIVKPSYWFWEQRGGLIKLYSPPKTYSNLMIHHWDIGSGKSQGWKRRRELLDGFTKAILEIPEDERVLVIHPMKQEKDKFDVKRELERRLKRRKVSFLHHGNHRATNEFGEVKHVFLFGLLFYSNAEYHALTRAAMALETEEEFNPDEFKRIRHGEIAANTLQAACRGNIRKTENGDCPTGCNLYLAFSTHPATGFPVEMLSEIFPKAEIRDWNKTEKVIGRIAQAARVVLSDGEVHRKAEVRERLGGISAKALRNAIAQLQKAGVPAQEDGQKVWIEMESVPSDGPFATVE